MAFIGSIGPESLEADRIHPRNDEQDTEEGQMDTTEGHSAQIVPGIQCTDVTTDASRGGRKVRNPEEMSEFNSRLLFWGRYDENSAAEVANNGRIFKTIKEKFNETLKYDVKEPVGCALLVGCRGPEGKKLSGAVFQDLYNMKTALDKVGEWQTTCLTERDVPCLNKRTLFEKINDTLLYLHGRSIFLFYFSGHGNNDGVILDDGHTLDYKKIVNRVAQLEEQLNFTRNRRGVVKPKIFIFDMCRLENQSNKKTKCPKNFPPPHTLVCFSAAEGCESVLDTNEGSFYTLALAHSISSLGQRYSFHEVVTYAGHIARAVSEIYNVKPRQLPVFLSSMDKFLCLSGKNIADS